MKTYHLPEKVQRRTSKKETLQGFLSPQRLYELADPS
jgi:hypothetical protein